MTLQRVLWRVGGFGRYVWHRLRRHRAYRLAVWAYAGNLRQLRTYRVSGWAYACNTCDKDWR